MSASPARSAGSAAITSHKPKTRKPPRKLALSRRVRQIGPLLLEPCAPQPVGMLFGRRRNAPLSMQLWIRLGCRKPRGPRRCLAQRQKCRRCRIFLSALRVSAAGATLKKAAGKERFNSTSICRRKRSPQTWQLTLRPRRALAMPQPSPRWTRHLKSAKLGKQNADPRRTEDDWNLNWPGSRATFRKISCRVPNLLPSSSWTPALP